MASVPLVSEPQSWINRRVEAVELLSHEETRRRVSIDFTLPSNASELEVSGGIAVPISLLTKEARRNFDMRNEAGRSIPVLGKEENGQLAHVVVLSAALDALRAAGVSDQGKVLEVLSPELREIVCAPPERAHEALAFFVGSAEGGHEPREAIWLDRTARQLLTALADQYILYALVQTTEPPRRILKYSYGEDFDLTPERETWRERFSPREVWRRVSRPDRARFFIDCPGAPRASSFHAEIAIPEELRIDRAELADFSTMQPASEVVSDVDRASLYADRKLDEDADVAVYLEVSAERTGRVVQAAFTGVVIALLLWLGVLSELDATNAGPAVSILLSGAAVFSSLTARQGEHRLVAVLFRASTRWLSVVTLAALAGSATLAMEYPDADPVEVWCWAALACSVAALRLSWSAVRAPR